MKVVQALRNMRASIDYSRETFVVRLVIRDFLLVFWRVTQLAVSEDSRVVYSVTIYWILTVNFLLGHFSAVRPL